MGPGTRLAVVCVLVLVAGLDVACSSDGNDSLRDMLMQQLPEGAKSKDYIMPNYLPPGIDPDIGVLPYPPNGISVFFASLDDSGVYINIIEIPGQDTVTPEPSLDPSFGSLWTVRATVIKGTGVEVQTLEHSALLKTDIGTTRVLVQVDDPHQTLSISELEREAIAIVESMVD